MSMFEQIFDRICQGVTSLKCWPVFRPYYQKMRKYIPIKPQIPFLVVSLGHACNLKCRDCSNFCPSAPLWRRKYDPERTLSSIRKILSLTRSIRNLQIQGGEPFLFADLGSVVKALGPYVPGKIKLITIATNGTIVPNDDLCEILSQYHVLVRISDYFGDDDGKVSALTTKLTKYGISHTLYPFAKGLGKWMCQGDAKTIRENNNDIVRNRYLHCPFRGCLTLEEDILSHCSRAQNAQNIQMFVGGGDYFKIIDNPNLDWKDLYVYVQNTIPFMEACRYCYGGDGANIDPAIQMK